MSLIFTAASLIIHHVWYVILNFMLLLAYIVVIVFLIMNKEVENDVAFKWTVLGVKTLNFIAFLSLFIIWCKDF